MVYRCITVIRYIIVVSEKGEGAIGEGRECGKSKKERKILQRNPNKGKTTDKCADRELAIIPQHFVAL